MRNGKEALGHIYKQEIQRSWLMRVLGAKSIIHTFAITYSYEDEIYPGYSHKVYHWHATLMRWVPVSGIRFDEIICNCEYVGAFNLKGVIAE